VQACNTVISGSAVQTAARATRAWLAANSFSPRFQVRQAGCKMEAEDDPFIKVSL